MIELYVCIAATTYGELFITGHERGVFVVAVVVETTASREGMRQLCNKPVVA